jgi:dTDP-4-dehydrorhamnose reductase
MAGHGGEGAAMKLLVIGARGTLGAATIREFSGRADVVGLGRADLDITDDAAVLARVGAERPDVLINCSAYNAVDAAEDDPLTALNVNAIGVRALARAATAVDATLVHYSTDFVFDGRTDHPYSESDATNPESVYAVSKLLGEWFAADVPRHYVLRVESLFSDERTGSAGAIAKRIEEGAEVAVFVDRTVSPAYVVDIAAVTREILDRSLPGGIYHCVNSGHCTWWEFAEEVARLLDRPARLKPITLDSVKLRARRPTYSALANDRLIAAGIHLPDWRDALRRSLQAPART